MAAWKLYTLKGQFHKFFWYSFFHQSTPSWSPIFMCRAFPVWRAHSLWYWHKNFFCVVFHNADLKKSSIIHVWKRDFLDVCLFCVYCFFKGLHWGLNFFKLISVVIILPHCCHNAEHFFRKSDRISVNVCFSWLLPTTIAGQQIVKVLTVRSRTVNALTLYLWSSPLTLNGQRIFGLCKSLTVNAVNFSKVGNG
jgi:hypothetical protein